MTDGELHKMTMAELAEEAHRVGIPNVAHMSTEELIEAIEQQRETNAVSPDEPPRRPPNPGSLPEGWENFPG